MAGMRTGILKIATCQFAVGPSIERNAEAISGFLHQAKDAGAEIAHFSECALSGYAGTDFASLDDYDWPLLRSETQKIAALAGRLGLWVVLGSTHPLTEPNKPHNCLYLIDAKGNIADRYDKRFGTPGDLDHYAPGDRFVTFTLNGVKCALLICFDLRFPELYRELYKQGTQCIFQSFYNARQDGPSVHTHIMRQTMQCHAATNFCWVSLANSSAYCSPYPSCFIEPDGVIAGQLTDNEPGMLISTVDMAREFYDPMKDFRDLAVAGRLTNGPGPLDDPRSTNTREL
ncbi:carbon-nitrogen hydrolase family protein [Anaerobaca lacustris]|uniref:Carbon-nitrogen hydrolase family protein n=1 Tax=Anaerobaca lacustris TaxID=3044600 RepID=A0AAW6TZ00_9BACT|nr:carbon-nitrogen hydrolase family protein [Sedimentisphaerales bacterium M17dextr]